MSMHDLIRQLKDSNKTKIVMLVADGLGGLPIEPGGKTELETARTPNLDRLATEGTVGLSTPVAPGITPGSGPGHLGLFGFDPLENDIGRGVLEALGIGVEVGPKDVAIRGNFCTIDADGVVTDRRAGRIPTEVCEKLVEKLRAVKVEGVETLVEPVREYRLVVRFRGEGLGDNVADTDPLSTGLHTLEPKAGDAGLGEDREGRRRVPPPGQGDPQGREPGQLPDDAGVRQVPRHRHDGGGLRPEGRRHRRLPDVPGAGPARRA